MKGTHSAYNLCLDHKHSVAGVSAFMKCILDSNRKFDALSTPPTLLSTGRPNLHYVYSGADHYRGYVFNCKFLVFSETLVPVNESW